MQNQLEASLCDNEPCIQKKTTKLASVVYKQII